MDNNELAQISTMLTDLGLNPQNYFAQFTEAQTKLAQALDSGFLHPDMRDQQLKYDAANSDQTAIVGELMQKFLKQPKENCHETVFDRELTSTCAENMAAQIYQLFTKNGGGNISLEDKRKYCKWARESINNPLHTDSDPQVELVGPLVKFEHEIALDTLARIEEQRRNAEVRIIDYDLSRVSRERNEALLVSGITDESAFGEEGACRNFITYQIDRLNVGILGISSNETTKKLVLPKAQNAKKRWEKCLQSKSFTVST